MPLTKKPLAWAIGILATVFYVASFGFMIWLFASKSGMQWLQAIFESAEEVQETATETATPMTTINFMLTQSTSRETITETVIPTTTNTFVITLPTSIKPTTKTATPTTTINILPHPTLRETTTETTTETTAKTTTHTQTIMTSMTTISPFMKFTVTRATTPKPNFPTITVAPTSSSLNPLRTTTIVVPVTPSAAERPVFSKTTAPALLLQERDFVVDAAGNTLSATQYPTETTAWWEHALGNGDTTWTADTYTQTFATGALDQLPSALAGSIGLGDAFGNHTGVEFIYEGHTSINWSLSLTGAAAGVSCGFGGLSLLSVLALAVVLF